MEKLVQKLSVGVVLLALSTSHVFSQELQRCSTRDIAISWLDKKYKEQIVGRGITPNGNAILELLVSKDGSWTILTSHATGESCVLASGQSWQLIPLMVGDPA